MYITGYYGLEDLRPTPCKILVLEREGGTWYCVEGSQNVNFTPNIMEDNINVEELEDLECFQADEPVMDFYDLEHEVKDFLGELPTVTSMSITLDDLSNQAMIDDARDEVIGILYNIIDKIVTDGIKNCDGLVLRDSNGNRVGEVSIDE